MRITNNNQIMSQLGNMNTTLNNLNNSNNKMSSQRKFDHAFEDVASATRAMRLRKSLRDKDFYMSNIKDARGRINSGEDALQTSVTILRTVTDRVEQALNGTYGEDDRKKIAREVQDLQGEVMALMNSSYTDHFVFDAAGGAVKGEQPFTNESVSSPVMIEGKVPLKNKDGQDLYIVKEGATPVYDAAGNKITGDLVEGAQKFFDAPPAVNPGDPTPKEIQLDDVNFFERKTVKGMMQKVQDKLDANGAQIPAKDDQGNVIAGKFEQEGVWETRKTLTYHDMPVDEMSFNKETGKVEWYNVDPKTHMVINDPLTGNHLKDMPYNATNYVDIGLGHKFLDTPDGKVINPETVLPYTFSGVEIFGMGKTEDGLSNNLYSALGEIVTSLNDNNMDKLGDQFDHISSLRSTLLMGLTDIGARSNFIDDMDAIHTSDKFNYQTRQTDIEAVNLSEESMYNKNHEMAWMVTLQLGSKVLPSSLFDFMR